MEYEITVSYSEKNGAHEIVEKWRCRGEKPMKRTLGEALDMQIGPDRIPVRPDGSNLDALRRLGCGEAFTRDVLRRLERAWKAYSSILSAAGAETEIKVDRHTTVRVRRTGN